MDITPFVDSLRRDLQVVADVAGPDVREAAERLTLALEPSVRLMLMEALSQAASEITADLPVGSVDARLTGGELEFSVQAEPVAPRAPEPESDDDDEDDSMVARITLRIPEQIKAKAEVAASESGQSLNAWLVTVVRNAIRPQPVDVVDWTSPQIVTDARSAAESFRNPKSNRRMTGWL